jgi:glycosyltransferase involved in cell wall biosynthesis
MTRTLLIFNRNDIDGLKHIWNLIPFDLFDQVVAIDGHSTDGSYEFLASTGVRTYLQMKMGRGNALAEAMQLVEGDAVVELSSDGNEDPRTIPLLLREIDNGADLVIASRLALGGRTDDTDDPMKVRRLGNRLLTFLINVLWGAKLTDSTNGLRAFRTDAWQKMHLDASHFEAEFLMSIRAIKLKLRVAEVPTVEGSRVGGEVQAKTSKVGIALLHVVVREMLEGSRFVR